MGHVRSNAFTILNLNQMREKHREKINVDYYVYLLQENARNPPIKIEKEGKIFLEWLLHLKRGNRSVLVLIRLMLHRLLAVI